MQKLIVIAKRLSIISRKRYYIGAVIQCSFPDTVDLEEGQGSGPWSPGGYSVAWLKANALEIQEMGAGKVIHSCEDTPATEPHPAYCCCPACKPRRNPRYNRKSKVNIHIFVDGELKARVAAKARERGLDLSDIAREALEEWLEAH